MDHDTEPIERAELALVDRLWRSGPSAVVASPSTRDDLSLLQRYLSMDDRAAMAPLLRHHRVATWRLAAVVTMDMTAAAAAVDTAWREVLDGDSAPISTWSNPRAWLFRITRRHALAIGAGPGGSLERDPDDHPAPFDHTGDVAELAASFALLDEPSRTAVWLHAVEDFDDVDAAHVIDRERLETHELIDRAMADLRVRAVHAQLAGVGERCSRWIRCFLDYLEDDLEPEAERDLLEHLGRCRRCAARLDAVEVPGLSLVDRVLAPPRNVTAGLRELVTGRG